MPPANRTRSHAATEYRPPRRRSGEEHLVVVVPDPGLEAGRAEAAAQDQAAVRARVDGQPEDLLGVGLGDVRLQAGFGQQGARGRAGVMPPTGKAFAITQTHWFRTRDSVITEHWANRDDLASPRPTRPALAPPGQPPPGRASPERTGSRVSLRQDVLDLGFHRVPNGPERPDRDADGAGVI